jgi:hypothetical protein
MSLGKFTLKPKRGQTDTGPLAVTIIGGLPADHPQAEQARTHLLRFTSGKYGQGRKVSVRGGLPDTPLAEPVWDEQGNLLGQVVLTSASASASASADPSTQQQQQTAASSMQLIAPDAGLGKQKPESDPPAEGPVEG